MRLMFFVVSVLVVPLWAVAAEPTKPVEIKNFPEVQDVFVTNSPEPSPPSPSRFQFVGFTTAIYTGNLGGYFGAARKCQLEFEESRICHISEVEKTTILPDPISNQIGWVDVSLSDSVVTVPNCNDWRLESASSSSRGITDSGSLVNPGSCSVSHVIACCALVP